MITNFKRFNENILLKEYPNVKYYTEGDYFPFNNVIGKIDSYSVNLNFIANISFSINGIWNDDTDIMDSIFKLNNIEIDFNYHPFNPMGGSLSEEFEKSIATIYDLVHNPDKYEMYKINKKTKKYNI